MRYGITGRTGTEFRSFSFLFQLFPNQLLSQAERILEITGAVAARLSHIRSSPAAPADFLYNLLYQIPGMNL